MMVKKLFLYRNFEQVVMGRLGNVLTTTCWRKRMFVQTSIYFGELIISLVHARTANAGGAHQRWRSRFEPAQSLANAPSCVTTYASISQSTALRGRHFQHHTCRRSPGSHREWDHVGNPFGNLASPWVPAVDPSRRWVEPHAYVIDGNLPRERVASSHPDHDGGEVRGLTFLVVVPHCG